MALGTDGALLLSRVGVAAFLFYQIHDNVLDPARMNEFADFLDSHGYPVPELTAPVTITAQGGMALALVAGYATRWVGLAMMTMFVIALVTVHLPQPFNLWWPALALVLLGAIHATAGAGRISIDGMLEDGGSGGAV